MTNSETPASEPARESALRRFSWHIGVVVVLTLGAGLLSHRIMAPFTGWHDWNSAWYSYFARNHLRYGLSYTLGLPTHGDTLDPPAEPHRYLSHPALISLWVACSMRVFGDHVWAARLVPILSALGGAWVLMVLMRRMCPADSGADMLLSVLCGLFYVMLPMNAYFGRMVDHLPVAHFFTMLMLYGYLRWTGECRGEASARRWGGVWFTMGTVLGIGTAWAAAILSGLIWLRHSWRVISGRAAWTGLLFLGAVPAISLGAVFAHIVWSVDWNWKFFRPLFATRSFGTRPEMAQPVLEWLVILGGFARQNFTLFAGVGVLVYLLLILAGASMPVGRSPVRKMLRAPGIHVPFSLTLAHGLIYVVLFKNQSWIHDYWQYFLGPAAAVAMGTSVCAAYLALSGVNRVSAGIVAAVLVLLPIPRYTADSRDSFWGNYLGFHEKRHIPDEYVDAFLALKDPVNGIPAHAPVMTFRDWDGYEDSFGDYVHRYRQPQIAYHADRPLIRERNLARVLANEAGAAAYILELGVIDDPNQNDKAREYVSQMAGALQDRFESRRVGRQLIVYLNRARGEPSSTSSMP